NEESKDVIRRRTVYREKAKTCISFSRPANGPGLAREVEDDRRKLEDVEGRCHDCCRKCQPLGAIRETEIRGESCQAVMPGRVGTDLLRVRFGVISPSPIRHLGCWSALFRLMELIL